MYKETKNKAQLRRMITMKKMMIKTSICDGVDADITLNTGDYNGKTTISINNQNNNYTFNTYNCSMVLGSDLLNSLEKILDCYKDIIHEDRYYSRGEIINILLRTLLENEMCENENLYKALDDWYYDTDCEQEEN